MLILTSHFMVLSCTGRRMAAPDTVEGWPQTIAADPAVQSQGPIIGGYRLAGPGSLKWRNSCDSRDKTGLLVLIDPPHPVSGSRQLVPSANGPS
jgi:hypothetical protein